MHVKCWGYTRCSSVLIYPLKRHTEFLLAYNIYVKILKPGKPKLKMLKKRKITFFCLIFLLVLGCSILLAIFLQVVEHHCYSTTIFIHSMGYSTAAPIRVGGSRLLTVVAQS